MLFEIRKTETFKNMGSNKSVVMNYSTHKSYAKKTMARKKNLKREQERGFKCEEIM